MSIDDLIIKVLRGRATDAERERVEEWRRASPVHEDQYEQLAGTWKLTRFAVDDAPVGTRPTTQSIARRANKRRAYSRLKRLATAAVIAFALLGAGWLAVRWTNQPLITVAAVADQTVTLPDGSFVRLAAGSHLEYRERGGQRRVTLDGRGFFAVASDSTRAFRIRINATSVSVLGTRFDVAQRGDSVRVAVVEGLVALERDGETRQLAAGTVGVTHAGGVSISEDVLALQLLDWGAPFFLFQDTPVSNVIQELGSRLDQRVIIADSVIGRRLITSQFGNESFNDIMSTICVIADAQCDTVDGVWRIGR